MATGRVVLGTGRRAQVIAAGSTLDKKAKQPSPSDTDQKGQGILDIASVLISQEEIIPSTSVPSMRQ